MKRNILSILALVLALVFTMSACSKKDGSGSSSASKGKAEKENPASDFSYDLTKDGQGILIKGYTGKPGKVVIPSKIEDLPVLEIGNDAFNGKNLKVDFNGGSSLKNADIGSEANEKAGITAITIPNTVKKIGSAAFANLALTSLVIPDSVEFIDQFAFASNYELTQVTLPNGLKVIPYSAFLNCKKLTKINLPSSLEKIGWMAFSRCGELSELIIPETLTNVKFLAVSFFTNEEKVNNDNHAFEGCGKLPIATRQKIKNWGYTGDF